MPRKKPAAVPLVSAAARTLAILERLSASPSLGLEELSRATGLAKPTAHRFLLTLKELGYVRRDERERWAVTLKLFNVGSLALDHLDLHAAARPVAEELAAELGETVHVGVLDGDEAVYVIKIESRYTIRMYSQVGRRVPLYCSALGKVLLAWEDERARAEALGGVRFIPFTARTLRDRAELELELARVRETGWARDDAEREEGIHCLGAPIFDREGRVVAALSVSWPAFRWEGGREAEVAARVKEAADRVSAVLGHQS